MLNYEIYKIIHFTCIFLLLFCTGITLVGNVKAKWLKILGGISGLLIFVSGMGLIARIGIGHGEGWPLWIKAKIALWVTIAALGPIFDKRIKNNRVMASFVLLGLAVLTASFAVFKFGV